MGISARYAMKRKIQSFKRKLGLPRMDVRGSSARSSVANLLRKKRNTKGSPFNRK